MRDIRVVKKEGKRKEKCVTPTILNISARDRKRERGMTGILRANEIIWV